MPEIKKVIVTAMIGPENKEKLRAALAPAEVTFCMPYGPGSKEKIAEASREVDVAIMNGDVEDCVLASPNLKWIHCCRAGVEKSASEELFDRGIILTSSSGRSAPALAEHALMFMMALTYDLPGLHRAQARHQWAAGREYFMRTGMYRKTVGIIGAGKTGLELARLCKGFDMRVLGWRRTRTPEPNIDEMFGSRDGDDLKQFLSGCDYVVLSIELNDSTWHMIGAGELAAMKESAYLINMGRGALIDEPALIDALQSSRIAGAGLDTFETEPLPADSPFWDMANVIITPHITPQLPDREERMLKFVFDNIRAYKEGGGFVNLVTRKSLLTRR
ncbi:MAG: D-2-hydroxyacid dehydrogenase [Lachnospiraceae bacterium]|nr:D-2-hydroxyacid dehydrogenase [Lachnospiraceae bacterium]